MKGTGYYIICIQNPTEPFLRRGVINSLNPSDNSRADAKVYYLITGFCLLFSGKGEADIFFMGKIN